MRRSYLIPLAMTVILMALVGCGKKPSSVVEAFYTNLADGKVNDAFNMLSKESSAMLQAFGGSAAMMEQSRKIQKKQGIKKFEVLSEEVHGDTAQVKARITFGDGSTDEDLSKLMKTDDGWRIVVSK